MPPLQTAHLFHPVQEGTQCCLSCKSLIRYSLSNHTAMRRWVVLLASQVAIIWLKYGKVALMSTANSLQLLKIGKNKVSTVVFFCLFLFFVFFFLFLAAPWHMEFPGKGSYLSCSCDLCHSYGNTGSFNLLSWARDWTCVLGTAEMLPILLCHNGNSSVHF